MGEVWRNVCDIFIFIKISNDFELYFLNYEKVFYLFLQMLKFNKSFFIFCLVIYVLKWSFIIRCYS